VRGEFAFRSLLNAADDGLGGWSATTARSSDSTINAEFAVLRQELAFDDVVDLSAATIAARPAGSSGKSSGTIGAA
jgi:hypothetical protein